MTAALPGLTAAKQPGEVSVKLLKILVYLLESCRIHFKASPPKPAQTSQSSYQTNCRCNTSGDRLVDAVDQPIVVAQFGETLYRCHSTALGLNLCWEDVQLRW